MEFRRKFVPEGTDPFSLFEYESYDCIQENWKTKKIIFSQLGCEVPKAWSKNARDILITKYFRKGGIARITKFIHEDGVPHWLQRSEIANDTETCGETSVKQVVGRLVGHWTYVGFKEGYFDATEEQIKAIPGYMTVVKLPEEHAKDAIKIREQNAKAFYDETVYMLLNQMAAPNSPQFFNTGLYWAYGIEGKAQGHQFTNLPTNTKDLDKGIWTGPIKPLQENILKNYVEASPTSFKRVQGHACFILNVDDSMCSENGLLSWVTREGRIFKFGSGSGANISKVRGEKETLSGGGKSSGVMSFAKIADVSAGAIKSGGTTRRAAKMLVMNLDHPDIRTFVNCKLESEIDVANLVIGSKILTQSCQLLMDTIHAQYPTKDGLEIPLVTKVLETNAAVREVAALAAQAGVPHSYIAKAITMALSGIDKWPAEEHGMGFEDRAYTLVPWQNANNSVRIPFAFYDMVDADGKWSTTWRTTGDVAWSIQARDLEREIATATWFSGDPGTQYHDNVNDWNVTPEDGEITASNPCSEHMRLDGSACNLASLRITQFVINGTFDIEAFRHGVRIWQTILDITNTMAHLPDRDTAMGVYLYRDTGLGYADLGAYITSLGLAYDSDEARAVAAAVTALMHGEAHLTSALMAKELGAYPRFWANKEHHLRCVRNHIAGFDIFERFEGLHVAPPRMNWGDLEMAFTKDGVITGLSDAFSDAIRNTYYKAYEIGEEYGFRNAEMTLLAPTGTIGILMDCDTTGVEPMLGLMAMKTLVGGGEMAIPVAKSVETALGVLGYTDFEASNIISYITQTKGAIPVSAGSPDADIADPHIRPEHRSVFQCSLSYDPNNPPIAWQAHVKMMAAVQPFLSGAISKTVNMPSESTIEDVLQANRLSHDLALKAVAIYRDGSKLSQPLNLSTFIEKEVAKDDAEPTPIEEPKKIVVDMSSLPPRPDRSASGLGTEKVLSPASGEWPAGPAFAQGATPEPVSPPQIEKRIKLPSIRESGIDVAVEIEDGTLYVKTSRYPDGKVGEIWATYSAASGDLIDDLLDNLCRTANIALQYGVPLKAIVKGWRETKFEPNGLTGGHPYIKNYKSILNLIARIIGYHELGDTNGLQVKPPAELKPVGSEWVPTPIELPKVYRENKTVLFGDPLPPYDKMPPAPPLDVVSSAARGEECKNCGNDTVYPNGAGCKKCTSCGEAGGCG
jgi:ribonucleoside-diphosphate reductase alpha chain